MDFTKKNDFIVKHKKEIHFENDLQLFNQKCPNSKLQPELKRLNSFNRTKIHGMILYELLDKVSPEEILNYRVEKPTEAVIETVEQAITIINEIDPEFIPKDIDKDDLAALSKEAIGKNVEAFRAMARVLIEKDNSERKTETDLEKKEEELNDKESELDEKRSELDDKESELDEKEDELLDKEQELEEKKIILEEKTAELERAAAELKKKTATKTTAKKKGTKAKSSRK